MNTENTGSPKSGVLAKIAGTVAIAAWPVFLGLGWILSHGQDLAGAGMVQALGLIAAAAVSLLAGIVYLVARWVASRRD